MCIDLFYLSSAWQFTKHFPWHYFSWSLQFSISWTGLLFIILPRRCCDRGSRSDLRVMAGFSLQSHYKENRDQEHIQKVRALPWEKSTWVWFSVLVSWIQQDVISDCCYLSKYRDRSELWTLSGVDRKNKQK